MRSHAGAPSWAAGCTRANMRADKRVRGEIMYLSRGVLEKMD